MLHDTRSHSLAGFLAGDFSRVSPAVAQEICRTAKLSPDARPRNVHGEDAEALYKAIQATKIMAPPSNCISPIGEKAILHGLYKQIKGEFYTAVTRPPAVYRGNPFVIEAGLAFGKGPDQAAAAPDAPAAPLAEGEQRRGRRRAGPRHPLRQPRPAALPAVGLRDLQGRARDRLAELRRRPVAGRAARPGPWWSSSTWPRSGCPFTSESKEAIADYDEIRKEIKLALQECGRRLGVFLRRRERAKSEFRRRNIFELYIEEVVEACARLKGGKLPKEKLKDQLQKIAVKRTGGARTDEILGRDSGPEGLPALDHRHARGPEGEAPALPGAEPAARRGRGGAEPERRGAGRQRRPERSAAADDAASAGRPRRRGQGRQGRRPDRPDARRPGGSARRGGAKRGKR